MKLQTERLRIEEATVEDDSFFFRLLNSPNWIKHIGDRGIRTKQDALSYIEKSLIDSYTKLGFGLYKVTFKETNEPVGISGFLRRDYLEHPDIGFATLPEFEGRGYSFEAANAVLKFGREELNMKTVYAITSNENLVSQKLLVKIGLEAIGRIQPPNEQELILFSTETKIREVTEEEANELSKGATEWPVIVKKEDEETESAVCLKHLPHGYLLGVSCDTKNLFKLYYSEDKNTIQERCKSYINTLNEKGNPFETDP